MGAKQQKLDFNKGDNLAPCGKYFATSYVPNARDIAVLAQVDKKLNASQSIFKGLFHKSSTRKALLLLFICLSRLKFWRLFS